MPANIDKSLSRAPRPDSTDRASMDDQRSSGGRPLASKRAAGPSSTGLGSSILKAALQLNLLTSGAVAAAGALAAPAAGQAALATGRRGLRQTSASPVTLDMPTLPVGTSNAFAQSPVAVLPAPAQLAREPQTVTLSSGPGETSWMRMRQVAVEGQMALSFTTNATGALVDLQDAAGNSSGLQAALGAVALPAGAHQATLTWNKQNIQAVVDAVTTTVPRNGTQPLAPALGCQNGGSVTVSSALYNAAQSAGAAAPVDENPPVTAMASPSPGTVHTPSRAPSPVNAAAPHAVWVPVSAPPQSPVAPNSHCVRPTQQVVTGNFSAYDKYDPAYDAHITYTQQLDDASFTTTAQGLTLMVDEQFRTQPTINTSRWAIGNDDFHGGNGELESYRPSQVRLDPNAGIVLTAIDNGNGTYTSGKIYAVDPSIALQTGAIEFRASVPLGAGLWPAFWLLPRGMNDAAGHDPLWPVNGEIDNEVEGGYSHEIHGTVHIGAQPDADTAVGGIYDGCVDYADGNIHAFQTSWDKSQISWFIDGTRYKQVRYGDLTSDLATRMQQTFANGTYFAPIINLAVGGAFDARAKTAQAIAAAGTHFPAEVVLESVKIYQP